MSMYEIDSAYVRRCQKRLQEWGAPLSGWYCDYIYDVADEEADPDHIEYFETVSVGCICAGIMEGDILAARERERLMKNRANRKRNFPHRQWRKNWYGNYQLTYQGRKVFINNKGGNRYSVYVDGKTSWSYKGKPLDNFVSAAYAAFELADPIERIRP